MDHRFREPAHRGEFFSPLVRSIAEKEGVSLAELASLSGSGRESRVSKADLMAYLEKTRKWSRRNTRCDIWACYTCGVSAEDVIRTDTDRDRRRISYGDHQDGPHAADYCRAHGPIKIDLCSWSRPLRR